MKFTADVPVDLYGVENTRLVTRELVTLQVQVLGDNLLQDFIVVDSIREECILGLDAFYEHKFIIDGSERRIYRVKQTLKQDSSPTIVAREKITIKPFSATVVESEGNGAKLPPNLAFFFHRGPGLNSGVRVDPFTNKSSEETNFKIALVNETNKPISLPNYEIIGTLGFCRIEKDNINSWKITICIHYRRIRENGAIFYKRYIPAYKEIKEIKIIPQFVVNMLPERRL
ncbi:hypothetical protein OUZ56_018859 [Daphnia magna]|uniref:Uncharacterized protein n=1 Tax=Daphnia magna TaxID=35525 RepID=A0ABQ9Z9Y9_9CRUS|nr:hypothetical protein OUZ56_018859 [Daphnia magna]